MHNLSFTVLIGLNITLAWIPGHIDISGNEASDAIVRDAATKGFLVSGVQYLDINTAFCQFIIL